MQPATATLNPAENLVGQEINDTWFVVKKLDLNADNSTGGFFSIQYIVRNKTDSKSAFLKIFDVVKAIKRYQSQGEPVLKVLTRLSNAHSFEADLMKLCNEKKLTRIVRALDSGELALDLPPLGSVGFPYLVFELGDGDTHKIAKTFTDLGYLWWFQTLKQATIGISQLHKTEIAHQDFKPSNLVFFGLDTAKVTDLGRAVRKTVASLNDDRLGDGTYIPPEYLYANNYTGWEERYLALDLYLLGSFAYQVFTGVPITHSLLFKTAPQFTPQQYLGDFKDALPALQQAFVSVLLDMKSALPAFLRDELVAVIEQLCNPDPKTRGHPKNHLQKHGNKYSLERFISAFAHLERLVIINAK